MAIGFIPLHCHSSHSRGFGLIPELVSRAKGLGYPGLGLVDNDLFGLVEFVRASQKAGLKPIIGAELDGLIILVENQKGYENLTQIITEYHRKRELSPREGLIYLSRSEQRLRELGRSIPMDQIFQIVGPGEAGDGFNPIAMPEVNCIDGEMLPIFLKAKGLPAARPGRLKRPEMMAEGYHPEAVRNTLRIFERVDFDLKPRRGFPRISGDLASLLNGKVKDRRTRLRIEYELKIIREYGCEPLFLLVERIFRFARSRGIGIQLRGSALASLVLYTLGLSPINPLRYGLIFERFLNPKRDEPPDIDIDVDHRYRELIIDEVIRIVGSEYTARPAVINRFGYRGAFRSVALALGIPPDELKELELHKGEDLYQRVEQLARRMVGHPFSYSRHPGGVVLSNQRASTLAPLYPGREGEILELDKEGLEYLKIAKLDILGVRGMAQIELVDPGEDDKATFQLIGSGQTLGCFQIESPPMRRLLRRMRPRDIEELMLALALIRPGADQKGYLERREGRTEVIIGHPVLADTLGVLVYQEQVIEIARDFAGLDWADADLLRKGITNQDRSSWEHFRGIFWRGARRKGRGEGEIEACWRLITRFAAFGFNKAHSAGYGWLAYRAAYARVHKKVAFFQALLASRGGYYPLIAYINEARRSGIEILGPDINQSRHTFSIEGGAIRCGLDEIRGLSQSTIERILAHRPFTTVEEFACGVRPRVDELINLINAGGLDSLPGSRGEKFLRAMAVMRCRSLPLLPPVIPRIPEERSYLKQWEILGFIPDRHPLEVVAPDRRMKIGDLKEGSTAGITGLILSRRLYRDLTFFTIDDETGILDVVFSGHPGLVGRIATFVGRYERGSLKVRLLRLIL